MSQYIRGHLLKWGRKTDTVSAGLYERKMNYLQFHCSLLDQRVYDLYIEYKYVLLEKYFLDKEEFIVISKQMWIWLLLGKIANLGWGFQPWLWLIWFPAHLHSFLIQYTSSLSRDISIRFPLSLALSVLLLISVLSSVVACWRRMTAVKKQQFYLFFQVCCLV